MSHGSAEGPGDQPFARSGNEGASRRAGRGLRSRIQQIVDETLDAIAGQGQMDLIEEFEFRLPVTIHLRQLGIPEGPPRGFLQGLARGGTPLERCRVAGGNRRRQYWQTSWPRSISSSCFGSGAAIG